jgi:hypothetical protein
MSSSSISVDQHDDDISEHLEVESSSDRKVRYSSLRGTKQNRRQSRIPRSLHDSVNPLLASVAVAHGEDPLSTGGSSHSTRSSKSLKGMRSQRDALIESRHSRRSYGNRRQSTGVSAGGGSKNRETVTDDDAWQIFREALSNMA